MHFFPTNPEPLGFQVATDLKARTGLAVKIAKIHPFRFNEAVAAGYYPCAPATTPGAARVFDLHDIAVLTVYRHLIDEGMTPRAAGPLVCGLRELLRSHPTVTNVIWVKTSFGDEGWFPLQEFDRTKQFHNQGDIVSLREWRLEVMMARIVHELEQEKTVLGHG